MVRLFLEDEGFMVDICENGDACMEMARNRRPDLILLDILLKEGDGWLVLEKFRECEEIRDIPKIIITAKDDARIEEMMEGNSDLVGLIKKPFAPEVLVETVKVILD